MKRRGLGSVISGGLDNRAKGEYAVNRGGDKQRGTW